jgi:hypothetical protein
MRKQWVGVTILASALFGGDAFAQHKAPNQQPTTAETPAAPTGDVALGTVRLPRAVTADGKPLAAGSYTLRVTTEEAKPQAVGTTEALQRWAEFVRGGKVVGREVVSIVPAAEAKVVAKDAPPRAGTNKVQMLRGNDYLRVWANRGGNHYLVHLPVSGGGDTK